MSTKRTISHHDDGRKRLRKGITLEVKLDIIERGENGERPTDIAKMYNLPASTVRSIIKYTDKYRGYAVDGVSDAEKKIVKGRDTLMIKLEKLLSIWIEDQTRLGLPMNSGLIKKQALNLFDDLKQEFGESSTVKTFYASKGWFERFKKRNGMSNDKIKETVEDGEKNNASGYEDGDKNNAANYEELYEQILKEGDFPTNSQDFSTPKGQLKKAKTNLSFLLGGNLAGDFKLKPMLVYYSAQLNRQFGFEDLELTDGGKLIAPNNVPTTHEEVLISDEMNGEDKSDDAEIITKSFDVKDLELVFKHVEAIKNIIETNDPNSKRKNKVLKNLENSIKCYKTVYAEKRMESMQAFLDKVFTPKKPCSPKTSQQVSVK